MDFIAQFGAVSEMQTRFWARQISLAVQYLHTLGIWKMVELMMNLFLRHESVLRFQALHIGTLNAKIF